MIGPHSSSLNFQPLTVHSKRLYEESSTKQLTLEVEVEVELELELEPEVELEPEMEPKGTRTRTRNQNNRTLKHEQEQYTYLANELIVFNRTRSDLIILTQ